MSAEVGLTVYAPDADALIQIARHYPAALNTLGRLAKAGSLRLAGGVYREIIRGTDRLREKVQRWQRKWNVVVEADDPVTQGHLARIERQYGQHILVGKTRYNGLWSSAAGRKAADSQLVALAKTRGWTVVSRDERVSLVCLLENVPSLSWQELVRRVTSPEQLRLWA